MLSGVVGPVRTGKSTFIKRFMELMVMPNIENTHTRERARDELPQSANGKTVMTTEPKFVPNEAVKVNLGETEVKVRLIDCVGFIIPGAEGTMDGEEPRMVHTPWSEQPVPFPEAARIGTEKVINEHSTIGIVVTTDGTVTDLPRENYIGAEEQTIEELKEIDKPFAVILNSAKPYSTDTQTLRAKMEEDYGVPVLALNCAQLKQEDLIKLMEQVLYEFPVQEISFYLPQWMDILKADHWLKKSVIDTMRTSMEGLEKLHQLPQLMQQLEENEYIKKIYPEIIEMGAGSASYQAAMDDKLFYQVLSENLGLTIEDDYQLISTIRKLSEIKKSYDKVESALNDVYRKGYGGVSPSCQDITLDRPEMFRQGSRYGIRLKARGESVHMIRADIETEVSPIVGSEEQSKAFIDEILAEYDSQPDKIWKLNIFGRTVDQLINEGMTGKLYRMPEDAQGKLQETLQKIINEGSGGLICIIL